MIVYPVLIFKDLVYLYFCVHDMCVTVCLCAKAVVGSNGVQKIVPHILKQESQVIVIGPGYLGTECSFLSRAAKMKNPSTNSCTRKAQTPMRSKDMFSTTCILGV